MATLFVDKIDPQSGTTLSLGSSGDTLQATAGTTNNLGISEADQWRLTADITSNVDPISSNLERVDEASFAKIGSGMSVSSGIWSFPVTGLYQVFFTMSSLQTASDTITGATYVSSDSGSNYNVVATTLNGDDGSGRVQQSNSIVFVNVTNTSTYRIKFAAESISSGAIRGNSDQNETCFTFIRLGDSQ